MVGHRAVAARFDRYRLTAGYNGIINGRQFGAATIQWPTEYHYPDEVYDEALTIRAGGETLELHHARGLRRDVAHRFQESVHAVRYQLWNPAHPCRHWRNAAGHALQRS